MPTSLTPREHALAFNVASAFHSVAVPTLTALDAGLNEGPEYAAAHTPEIVVSVTNLGFALELYLKSIRAWIGLECPETHDLWVLYKSLPVEVKQEVERRYEFAVSLRPTTTLFTLHGIIEASQDSLSVKPLFPPAQPLLKDVSNLLRRAKRLAVSWRYPHDSVPVGQRYSDVNTFEHSHLAILANTLCTFLQERSGRSYAETAV